MSKSGVPLAPVIAPVLIGFALLSLLAWLLWRRFRRTESTLTERLLIQENDLKMKEQEVETYRKAWHIPAAEITFEDCIGRGAVGEVFRAIWRDMPVAAKTVKGAWMSSEEIERELDHEASMLRTVRHAHVVQFFGAGTLDDGTPFLVTELMELGTLTNVLHNSSISLDWCTKQRFARETALGMALVHSLGRMHRDLKSGNILVTASSGIMRLKVADFGTATLATIAHGGVQGIVESVDADFHCIGTEDENRDANGVAEGLSIGPLRWTSGSHSGRVHTIRTKGVGTPLWMAPEILAGEARYGPSADVYSFGIVMWEIASRDEPWKNVHSTSFLMNALLDLIRSGERPEIKDDWPILYVELMKRCWATDAAVRPTFAQVATLLEEKVRRRGEDGSVVACAEPISLG